MFEAPRSCICLSPVVSGAGLPKHKVVRAEQLAEWPSSNAVHGSCQKGFWAFEDRQHSLCVCCDYYFFAKATQSC